MKLPAGRQFGTLFPGVVVPPHGDVRDCAPHRAAATQITLSISRAALSL